jgi:septum formation protein
MPPVLCLASASPRRRELLWQIGVPHEVEPADLDESVRPDEQPADYVARLAEAKAQHVFTARLARGAMPLPVLGADTTVTLGQRILGKPQDEAELQQMLAALSAREHLVYSAVAVVTGAATHRALVATGVTFRALEAAEISQYWQSGEPRDKAGGYAIQGRAAVFVTRLEGSYSGVVGLPLAETAALLRAAGVPIWQGEA